MSDRPKGFIGFMTAHRVAPNLLMLVLILGGLYMTSRITQEVFPDFQRDAIDISVSYPNATPEEIEQGVVLPVEEAVRGLIGIKDVTSTAREGSGSVTLELIEGADLQRTYQDVIRAVDQIQTFPDDAEEPEIEYSGWRRDVLDVLVYGAAPDQSLRTAAEQIRDRLLLEPGITQADLDDVRDYEIHIDIAEDRLRAYGLTLDEVAGIVAESARDRSAGAVETAAGEILLQVDERRSHAEEFRDIVIRAGQGGSLLRLGDIATITDGFSEDVEDIQSFNGMRAIEVEVFRVGSETPISVSDAVHAALPDIRAGLPPAIDVVVQSDASEVYKQRLELLLKNGFFGLLLVLALLSLFLEFKLAFWVTVGIPTAFLGAFLFLPGMGVSINMISLFAFIIALGIVVDDAIVAGENIYEYRSRGMPFVDAATQGAKDIAVPILISVITNIVAFLPLAAMPGPFGQIWAVIPAVVGSVFLISLVEALIILPAHLAYVRDGSRTRFGARLHDAQQRFSRGFSGLIERVYGRALSVTLRWRYVTLAAALTLLAITLAYPLSGRMGFILMPRVQGDTVEVTATLPYGAPTSEARRVRAELTDAARRVIDANGGDALSKGVYASIEDNVVEARIYLTGPDQRPITTAETARKWRRATGEILGVESLRFDTDRGGPGGGAGVTVQLSHSDVETLNRAAAVLGQRLAEVNHVTDVDDSYAPGKPRWSLRLTEAGRALGLTSGDIASQVRDAFYGAEAFKLLRGANEVTVRVQLPPELSKSSVAVSSFMIRTEGGQYVPLDQVARIEPGTSLTSIRRENGRRVMPVSANVEPIEQTNRVLATLRGELLPQLMQDFPGLSYSFGGRQESMRDSINSFYSTVTLALLVIFVLLALPFRSYTQPLIVMTAIPFGIVGAVLGHLIMGYSLSLISIMGIIALGGVVVNGSLVLIDYANARQREGYSAVDAIHAAGVRRFRPIFLTTCTTFGGLAPMIFETSVQAKFMIPMAISLGYGILFSSALLLLVVPSLYMVLEDIVGWFSGRARSVIDDVLPDAPQARQSRESE
ncbi:efflux RND transporter permease subunit [Marinobacter bohaiensis]|uniref:efflux RND transporter permease subunit n=1 Tax=Marinobacter bohaiensis TaxID=2201898 RepID=UPI000DABD05E|nr:efflux RND transporter permease subunit [Marinobacter bohaiensis]